MPILYRVVRPIISFLFKIFYRPKIIGREYIPDKGPYILAGNHTSYFDPVMLISIDLNPIHFLAKHTLLKGIKGPIFKGMGIIPVDRTKKKNSLAIEKSKEILKNGGIIGIFPEGTINRTDKTIIPFKMGTISIAKSTGAPIVPFAIKGKYKMFKNNLTIEFSKAYVVKSNNLEQENAKLMKAVQDMLEREQI